MRLTLNQAFDYLNDPAFNTVLWSFIYGKISFEKNHPITRLAGMIFSKNSFAQRETFQI